MNASRKSKRELIVKREQEIAVKDLLLGKNVLAILPTGYGKSLIFTLFLLARENITRINTDGRIVFLATGFITGLLRPGLLAASLSELFKAFVTTRLRSVRFKVFNIYNGLFVRYAHRQRVYVSFDYGNQFACVSDLSLTRFTNSVG